MSAPGTAALARVLSGRFNMVAPNAVDDIAGQLVPVFVCGDQNDPSGIGARPCGGFNPSAAAIGQLSWIALSAVVQQGAALRVNEYVIRRVDLWTLVSPDDVDVFPLDTAAVLALGGAGRNQRYLDEARIDGQGLQMFASVGPTAVAPATLGIETMRFRAGVNSHQWLEMPPLLLRPGMAWCFVGRTLNNALNLNWAGTERPLSA